MRDEYLEAISKFHILSGLTKKEFLKQVMLAIDDKKEFGVKSCYCNVGEGYDNCFGIFKRTKYKEEEMSIPLDKRTNLLCPDCNKLIHLCTCKEIKNGNN